MAGRGMGIATKGGGCVGSGPRNKMVSETSKKSGPVMMAEGGEAINEYKRMAMGEKLGKAMGQGMAMGALGAGIGMGAKGAKTAAKEKLQEMEKEKLQEMEKEETPKKMMGGGMMKKYKKGGMVKKGCK